MNTRPYRQVHLDFHTAPECVVGDRFDPDAFAQTVKDARIESLTVFSKCHHGYSYYPTALGTQHPGLKFDLLGQQIEALHAIGIQCPIYYSIRWDELAGQQHPEWLVVDKEGRLAARPPLSNRWGWRTLDPATGYGDAILAQVEELCQLYPVDGFFFDICFPLPNYSPWALEQMRRAGVRRDNDQAVWEFARRQQEAFFERLSGAIHRQVPGATIFYNGTISRDMGRVVPYLTHFEVESLPTASHWGYLHFPMAARQARTYGREIVGMTGRFHGGWGDFGGLKTQAQLEYEVGTILAAGGKISIGDQLHPSGALDPAVYRLIGQAYRRVEALEPWLSDAAPRREAAILALGPIDNLLDGIGTHSRDVEGAAQVFLELGVQFDIIEPQVDFAPYQTLVLPDQARCDDRLRARLDAFLASGGRLILSGTAALDAATGAFALSQVPVRYEQPAPTIPAYLRLDTFLAAESELASDYDYAFYEQAHRVTPVEGATVYGELRSALFNRTWEHFMGHLHAPVAAPLNAPIAARQGSVLYLAAPLFSAYRLHDYWAYRAILRRLLADFLPPRLLEPDAPGWVECSLHGQPAAADRPARQVVHLVAYHPRRTLQPIQHVDSGGLTAGIALRVRADDPPRRVYLAPDGQTVPFTVEEGAVRVDLPPLGAHTVLVIE
ncbi:MAG: beta-galactosidase trimerization domain-containing protein [Anaerolineae bacterium]|nr:beta-galactosidase trimerization domain-containing protein [Anaerolineae bacterium]